MVVMYIEKSCIRETKNLTTDADSSTNLYFFRCRRQKGFYLTQKKYILPRFLGAKILRECLPHTMCHQVFRARCPMSVKGLLSRGPTQSSFINIEPTALGQEKLNCNCGGTNLHEICVIHSKLCVY